MTPIELLSYRASNDAVIVMMLQEWRDLWEQIWALPPEEQEQFFDLEMAHMYMGKPVDIGTEPA